MDKQDRKLIYERAALRLFNGEDSYCCVAIEDAGKLNRYGKTYIQFIDMLFPEFALLVPDDIRFPSRNGSTRLYGINRFNYHNAIWPFNGLNHRILALLLAAEMCK